MPTSTRETVLSVTKIVPRKGETHEALVGRIIEVVAEMDDDTWESLGDEAQAFCNSCIDYIRGDEGKPLPQFPGEEAPVEKEETTEPNQKKEEAMTKKKVEKKAPASKKKDTSKEKIPPKGKATKKVKVVPKEKKPPKEKKARESKARTYMAKVINFLLKNPDVAKVKDVASKVDSSGLSDATANYTIRHTMEVIQILRETKAL